MSNLYLLKEVVHELGHLNLLVPDDSLARHVLNEQTAKLWTEIRRLEDEDRAARR